LQSEFNIDVHWTAFPLHPETPAEGRTLEDLFAGRPINIPEMIAHMKKVAGELGLPFGDRHMTYNSRLAQELGKWAELQGKGEEYHLAAFKAYFADGLNISNADTLIELGKTIGLLEKEIQPILENRTYKDAVDSDWFRAYEFGITAVPSFMIHRKVLVGAQPYDVLKNFLESNQVPRRNAL
jgi:predicted DsbA family dithiol-disulfide isomerase